MKATKLQQEPQERGYGTNSMNMSKQDCQAMWPELKQKLRDAAFKSWGNEQDLFADANLPSPRSSAAGTHHVSASSRREASNSGSPHQQQFSDDKIYGLIALWRNMDGASAGHAEIADIIAALEYFEVSIISCSIRLYPETHFD